MCIIQNISVKLQLNRNNWCQHYLPSSMTTSTCLYVHVHVYSEPVSPHTTYLSTVYLCLPHTTYMYMSTVYLYLPILHTCLQCTSVSPYYIHVHVYSVPLSPHTTYMYMSTVYLYLPILHTCTCLQCTSISPYYIHVHVYSVPLSPHTTYMYMSTVYLYLPILHTCTCLQCTSISPYYIHVHAQLYLYNVHVCPIPGRHPCSF